jgi:gamma-glutamyltranspeptidase/glutathione hydrolase
MRHSAARAFWVAALVAVATGACSTSPKGPPRRQVPPPTPTPIVQRALPDTLRMPEVVSKRGMVVTANAAASWAGARMLETGGNAIDAAVAAALALTVADPGSSGIGGQTYILIRLADGRSVAIDGSARAPVRASVEEMQRLREEQQAVRPGVSFYGYKAVATPGTLVALDLALRRYGTKSLAEVLAPAIEAAELGTTWTPAHDAFMIWYLGKVEHSPYLAQLLLKDGVEPWGAGHVYCNPDLACLLRRLAANGIEDFYQGEIAREIAEDMAAHGGWLRVGDLGSMQAQERRPVQGRYRGLDVLSFPFPGGGSTVVEALAILDRFPPQLLREDTVDRLHLLVEACRLAYADSFPARRPNRPPDEMATDTGFVSRRAALIRFDRALYQSEVSANALSTIEVGGTSQVSTADPSGNVVALTQTLGATFGSGVATAGLGFPYNSLMNAYEFEDRRAWSYLTPLQPPMTSMAPTILVKDGTPLLVLGSAGTARIAPLIVNTIVGLVDRRRPLCEAMGAPRALWGGNVERAVYIEIVDPITEAQADALKTRGFAKQERLRYPASALDLTDFGGVNALFIDPTDGTMVGIGDSRRQGVALAPRDGPLPAEPPLAPPACWRSLFAER